MQVNTQVPKDTLPKNFVANYQKLGDSKVAIRQKDFGIWQEFTWKDSYENVRDLGLGLVAMGLERGDRVTIVGDNDRQYLWADLAIMSVGAVAVGIFTDAILPEVEYVVTHSEAVFAFAKDQEQCDKMLDLKDKLPNIRRVIYWDPKGMWSYDDPWLVSFEEVQEKGRELHKENPQLFDDLVAQGKPDDLVNMCYTSGTTGMPKGAMLTNDNFISAYAGYDGIDPRYSTDNILSFSPLAWIAEHTLSVTPHVIESIIVNFPESPETIQQNIREIAPEVVFYPARLWEGLTATIQVRITDSTWINRTLYKLFLPVGYKMADKHFAKEKPGLGLRTIYWLGDKLVFHPLRNQFGLVNIRTAITAGAALSPDMFRFFRALGLNLIQVFSSTETAAVGTQHYPDDIKFASVGKPNKGIDMKITEEGEICLAGGNIFQGYYKNEEATQDALQVDDEGRRWFFTGDAGYVDEDGHLIYLDRVKDMIELASGEKFSPQFIEGRLKFSPFIRDVMAVGGPDKDYVSALISIDFDNVGRWAEKRGLAYTTYVDLSQRPEIYEMIFADVQGVNHNLPPGGRVRKFVLMHKEFDADEAEMTRTRKLRRGYLNERYQEMITSIYAGEEKISVKAPIKYQDGREGFIETSINIISVEEAAAK
ncbi:MAG: AMP-binding protein [Anaerolineae bacterium]|nr:AMP-binding protein [Anaerolineae bacterium]